MASEASWQTSTAGRSDPFAADEPMDQRTVESLLRRLVERVEESERRYGEALDELHARLDQLSQTTEVARNTGAPEDADTFDRLHTQVSNLARRLEQESAAPLDDFERLGRALSDTLGHSLSFEETAPEAPDQSLSEEETAADATPSSGGAPEPSSFAQSAMSGKMPESSQGSHPSDFDFDVPDESLPPVGAEARDDADYSDLDKRLVEMAQRLERSIGSAMPTSAIESLNVRLDEIGGQLSQALERAPTREAIEHIERQIADMSQQLSRAEEQLGKVAGIEEHLIKLIARVDEKAGAQSAGQMDETKLREIASKAATEAAQLVAGDANKSAERLDAIQRDITAMTTKNRESGDRLVSTLEAVHESLKQLVQQVERGAPLQPKARAPFTERVRQTEAKLASPLMQSQAAAAAAPAKAPEKPAAPAKAGDATQAAPKGSTLRERLGDASPEVTEEETPQPFGRAKRPSPDEEAVDLDAATPPRKAGMQPEAKPAANASKDAPDDLIAAARRAAQAAALRAEERSGRRRSSSALPGSGPAEQSGRRRRPVLIIAAAILLALSAVLLFSRLGSKSETETTAPASEESTPAPSDTESAPSNEGTAPATPDQSGAWEPVPGYIIPNDGMIQRGEATGVTDIAKSRAPAIPESELAPEPQLASLRPDGAAMLPPGVIFSVEEPADESPGQEIVIPSPQALATPTTLETPPAALGPLALRQAAAHGDATAQYVIAVNYAEGKGTKADLTQAATWLERAAAAGFAPAQYRLAAMYERGIGVDKDIAKARSWYLAAAERGNVKAMHNLAVSLSGRDGGNADYAQAAKWYRAAAVHGLADSQFNLGILAEHGLGMTKSLTEAYQWFALAAAHGDPEAAKRREVIRVQLAPETLAEAEAAVKAWKAETAAIEANDVAEQPGWSAAPAGQNPLVTRAQTLLNKLGYDVGPPDGIAGERTRSAVMLFERRNGLEETGEVSSQLVTTLERLAS